MITFIALIAGLILDTAGRRWFSGADTVGLILLIVGAVGMVAQFVLIGVFMKVFHSIDKR